MNNPKLIVRSLYAFVALFVVAALYGLWLLLFGSIADIHVSQPVFSGLYGSVSPVANNSVRFFNGRNFVEYNLKDGSSKPLFPSDRVYPSLDVITWSDDAQRVIIRTSFHRPDDAMARVRKQEGVDPRDITLWHLDLDNQSYTPLPAGYQGADFASDPQTLYLFESTNIGDAAHAEAVRISGFSLRERKITWSDFVEALPLSVTTRSQGDVLVALDSEAGKTALYTLKGNAQAIETPENVDTIIAGPQGYTAFEVTEEARATSEATEGRLLVFDLSFNELYTVDNVSLDYGATELDDRVMLSFLDKEDVLLHIYSRTNDSVEVRRMGTISGDGAIPLLEEFQKAQSSDLLFASDKRSIRYLGKDPNFKLEEDATKISVADAAAALQKLPFLSASEGNQAVLVILFAPLSNGEFGQINAQLQQAGLDPNLVPIFFSAEY